MREIITQLQPGREEAGREAGRGRGERIGAGGAGDVGRGGRGKPKNLEEWGGKAKGWAERTCGESHWA